MSLSLGEKIQLVFLILGIFGFVVCFFLLIFGFALGYKEIFQGGLIGCLCSMAAIILPEVFLTELP